MVKAVGLRIDGDPKLQLNSVPPEDQAWGCWEQLYDLRKSEKLSHEISNCCLEKEKRGDEDLSGIN